MLAWYHPIRACVGAVLNNGTAAQAVVGGDNIASECAGFEISSMAMAGGQSAP
jgi:hypothetical protein